MYLTTIKERTALQNSQASSTFIDALFDGVTLPSMNAEASYNPDTNLYRTSTIIISENDVRSNSVTQEMWDMAERLIDNRVDKHPNPETEYESFRIPKKTHGFREINAPKRELKEDQKYISTVLQAYLKTISHDSAWAYTPGRDVVHAMKEHTSNKSRWYLKIDLHNFFGSCEPQFIKTQLKKIYPFGKYDSDNMIDKIIKIAVLNNGLPQGTPLSPLLTNLIMVEFDYKINRQLYKLTKENKIFKQKYIYTRYADDIIISAKNKFDAQVILNMLEELFSDTPLTINREKTRFGSSAGRNWNLGIMCNKDGNTTVGYRRKQQLKSIVHNYIKARDEWVLSDLYWLQGQLSWLHNVEPEYFNGFLNYIKNKYDFDLMKNIVADIKLKSQTN